MIRHDMTCYIHSALRSEADIVTLIYHTVP